MSGVKVKTRSHRGGESPKKKQAHSVTYSPNSQRLPSLQACCLDRSRSGTMAQMQEDILRSMEEELDKQKDFRSFLNRHCKFDVGSNKMTPQDRKIMLKYLNADLSSFGGPKYPKILTSLWDEEFRNQLENKYGLDIGNYITPALCAFFKYITQSPDFEADLKNDKVDAICSWLDILFEYYWVSGCNPSHVELLTYVDLPKPIYKRVLKFIKNGCNRDIMGDYDHWCYCTSSYWLILRCVVHNIYQDPEIDSNLSNLLEKSYLDNCYYQRTIMEELLEKLEYNEELVIFLIKNVFTRDLQKFEGPERPIHLLDYRLDYRCCPSTDGNLEERSGWSPIDDFKEEEEQYKAYLTDLSKQWLIYFCEYDFSELELKYQKALLALTLLCIDKNCTDEEVQILLSSYYAKKSNEEDLDISFFKYFFWSLKYKQKICNNCSLQILKFLKGSRGCQEDNYCEDCCYQCGNCDKNFLGSDNVGFFLCGDESCNAPLCRKCTSSRFGCNGICSYCYEYFCEDCLTDGVCEDCSEESDDSNNFTYQYTTTEA